MQRSSSPVWWLPALWLATTLGGMLLCLNTLGAGSISLFVPATVLLVSPLALAALSTTFTERHRGSLFALLGLVSLFVFALIPIRARSVVGYADPHNHLFALQSLLERGATLDFGKISNVSYNFVALYLNAHFVSAISGAPAETIALFLPSLLGATTVIASALAIERLFSARAGILAGILIAFESQVILFGSEFRTQTLGVLFIFSILVAVFSTDIRGAARVGLSSLLIIGLVMSSFVSVVYALLIFVGVTIGYLGMAKVVQRGVPTPSIIGVGVFALLISGAFTYLIFVTGGFGSILQTMSHLVRDALSQSQDPLSVSRRAGQAVYGPFVRYVTFFEWATFALSAIGLLWSIVRDRAAGRASFAFAFGILLVMHIVNVLVGPLSPGRIYTVAFTFIATSIAFGQLAVADSPMPRAFRRALPVIMILAIAMAALAKLPTYIVGPMEPIRGEEPIDSASYWYPDPQAAVVAELACGPLQVRPTHIFGPLVPLDMQPCGTSDRAPGTERIWISRKAFNGDPYLRVDELSAEGILPERATQLVDTGDYAIYVVESAGLPEIR